MPAYFLTVRFPLGILEAEGEVPFEEVTDDQSSSYEERPRVLYETDSKSVAEALVGLFRREEPPIGAGIECLKKSPPIFEVVDVDATGSDLAGRVLLRENLQKDLDPIERVVSFASKKDDWDPANWKDAELPHDTRTQLLALYNDRARKWEPLVREDCMDKSIPKSEPAVGALCKENGTETMEDPMTYYLMVTITEERFADELGTGVPLSSRTTTSHFYRVEDEKLAAILVAQFNKRLGGRSGYEGNFTAAQFGYEHAADLDERKRSQAEEEIESLRKEVADYYSEWRIDQRLQASEDNHTVISDEHLLKMKPPLRGGTFDPTRLFDQSQRWAERLTARAEPNTSEADADKISLGRMREFVSALTTLRMAAAEFLVDPSTIGADAAARAEAYGDALQKTETLLPVVSQYLPCGHEVPALTQSGIKERISVFSRMMEPVIAAQKIGTGEKRQPDSKAIESAKKALGELMAVEIALASATMSPEEKQVPAEDARLSALLLLMMLAQAYYKMLESTISMASWCGALDLELNESYFWVITSLTNLLKNHKDLKDFPVKFEPLFPNLYPSTIRDLEWEDAVAPDAERFLSTVQQYVHAKGVYEPEQGSFAWTFIELYRPSVNAAIERAVAYNKRMRQIAQKAFAGVPAGGNVQAGGRSGEASGASPKASALRDIAKGILNLSNLRTSPAERIEVAGDFVSRALQVGAFADNVELRTHLEMRLRMAPPTEPHISAWAELIDRLRCGSGPFTEHDLDKDFAEDCQLVAQKLTAEADAMGDAAVSQIADNRKPEPQGSVDSSPKTFDAYGTFFKQVLPHIKHWVVDPDFDPVPIIDRKPFDACPGITKEVVENQMRLYDSVLLVWLSETALGLKQHWDRRQEYLTERLAVLEKDAGEARRRCEELFSKHDNDEDGLSGRYLAYIMSVWQVWHFLFDAYHGSQIVGVHRTTGGPFGPLADEFSRSVEDNLRAQTMMELARDRIVLAIEDEQQKAVLRVRAATGNTSEVKDLRLRKSLGHLDEAEALTAGAPRCPFPDIGKWFNIAQQQVGVPNVGQVPPPLDSTFVFLNNELRIWVTKQGLDPMPFGDLYRQFEARHSNPMWKHLQPPLLSEGELAALFHKCCDIIGLAHAIQADSTQNATAKTAAEGKAPDFTIEERVVSYRGSDIKLEAAGGKAAVEPEPPKELRSWMSIPEICRLLVLNDSQERDLRRKLRPFHGNPKLCDLVERRGSRSPLRRFNVEEPAIAAEIRKVQSDD